MTTERPMFPPVDPTRRRFLSQAASVAAGSAALALTTIQPQPVEAAPVSAAAISANPDSFIAPAMLEMGDEIDVALDAWIECDRDCKMRDRALRTWEERNPLPDFRLPDQEGYYPTYRSDWYERRTSVMVRLRLGVVKGDRNRLGEVYNDAVRRFSEHEASTPSELFLKVSFGNCVDNAQGLIAKSVLRDIYKFRSRLCPDLFAA